MAVSPSPDAPSFTPPTGPPTLHIPDAATRPPVFAPPTLIPGATPGATPTTTAPATATPETTTTPTPTSVAPASTTSGAPQPTPDHGSGSNRTRSRTMKRLGVGLLLAGLMVGSGIVGGVVARRDAPRAANETPGVTVAQHSGTPPSMDVAAVATAVAPSVVTIVADVGSGGGLGGGGSSVGTGVIVSADGEILTNNHVVEGADKIHVRLAGETEPHEAKLLAAEPGNDLALIKIESAGLTPATFAAPGNVHIGEPVVAIGFALDLDGDPSVTQGIVSAVDRTLVIDAEKEVLNGLVQTDAAISSGNSGGPLVNANGEVLGINTAVARGDSLTAASNVGFAISSAEVLRVLDQLRELSNGGSREEGYLGVEIVNRSDGGQGSAVGKVAPDSPAAAAGIQTGDIVIAVDDAAIDGSAGLIAAVRDHEPGDQVKVTVLRDGVEQTFDVTLTSRPN